MADFTFPEDQNTLSDAIRWFDYSKWSDYMLGVPNFANRTTTAHSTIHEFVKTISLFMQQTTFSIDASLPTHVTMNVMKSIVTALNRIRVIVDARSREYNELISIPTKASGISEEFLYSPFRFTTHNPFINQVSRAMMLMLTDLIQLSENQRPTAQLLPAMAELIQQYTRDLYLYIAIEHLGVKKDIARADNFVITDEVLKTYDPSKWEFPIERITVVRQDMEVSVSETLLSTIQNIPASLLLNLPVFPSNNALTLQNARQNTTGNNTGSTSEPVVPSFRPTT